MKKHFKDLVLVLFSWVMAHSACAYADNVIDTISAYNDQETVTFEVYGSFQDGNRSHVKFFIDADNNPDTGYSGWRVEGADYRVKDSKFYAFEGGEWRRISNQIDTRKQGDYISSTVPLDLLSSSLVKFTAVVMDSNWNNWEIYDEMIEYDLDGNDTGSSPFNEEALDSKLQYQEVNGSPEFIGVIGEFGMDNDNDHFYLSEDGCLAFEIIEWNDVESKRIELRDIEEWGIDTNTRKLMVGEVQFYMPQGEIDEITWMQVHHKHRGAKPFVRLVWKEYKEGHYDGLWAVIRESDESDGANWVYLGARPDSFFTAAISVENEELILEVDGNTYIQDVPAYWKNQRNYFKAGLYFSSRSGVKTRDARVLFKTLQIE